MELFAATIAGLAFILAGRWIQSHPKRVFPTWGLTGRAHPFLEGQAKLFGMLLVFGGSYVCLDVPTGLLVGNGAAATIASMLLLLPAAAATWLLRPRASQASVRTDPVAHDGVFTTGGKWFVLITLALATIFTIAITAFVFVRAGK